MKLLLALLALYVAYCSAIFSYPKPVGCPAAQTTSYTINANNTLGPLQGNAAGIAFDSSYSHLWYTSDSTSVGKIRLADGVVVAKYDHYSASNPIVEALGVALDSAGNIYVADEGSNHAVYKMSPSWELLSTFDFPQGYYQRALCVHVDKALGLVYVCSQGSSHAPVFIFDTDGNLKGNISTVNGAPIMASAVTTDDCNFIYVSDMNTAAGYKLSRWGEVYATYPKTGVQPFFITLDSCGTVYISAYNNNSFSAYSNGGALLNTFDTNNAHDIGADPHMQHNNFWGVVAHDNILINTDEFIFVTQCPLNVWSCPKAFTQSCPTGPKKRLDTGAASVASASMAFILLSLSAFALMY
jgi:hypothetical protein